MLKRGNSLSLTRQHAPVSAATRAVAALEQGDFTSARDLLNTAIKYDRKNPKLRVLLARTLATLGKRSNAAEHLTIALSLDPKMLEAARELNAIFDGGVLRGSPKLDAQGLAAALAFDTIDRDLTSAAIYHQLATTEPVRSAIEMGERAGWQAAAEDICFGKQRRILNNSLLLAVLGRGIIVRPNLEKLFTAVRRTLLLHPSVNFGSDQALTRFSAALTRQSWMNEFVWGETEEERRYLDSAKLLPELIDAGDTDACHVFVKKALYRRNGIDVIKTIDVLQLARVVSSEYVDCLRQLVAETDDVRARGGLVADLSPVTDSLSVAVATQYEHHPYPRWTSVPVYPDGNYFDHLDRHFRSDQLAFSRKPFEVLIAGCGTGRQAVSAALEYGDNARVLAIDISRHSLGYAGMMAERMEARNLSLARGDLSQIARFEPSLAGRFHVVECTGVLHHMADPFAAWRSLLPCLAPGGIMLIGLYSRTARQNLQRLKAESTFPGATVDDHGLRSYRQTLLQRPDEWPGMEYTRSRDFYSASGFRDFFLHVNEHSVSLTEIAAFLEENDLAFRGFVSPPFEALKTAYPAEIFPGSLARWADWEANHPHAFAGMYQFWCTAK